MTFPTAAVLEHTRRDADLLAGLLEQVTGQEMQIDSDQITFTPDDPDFPAYGLATWVVSNSITLSILIPNDILPTEWDGFAFAPEDIGERLVSALLPEDVPYAPPRLTTTAEVAQAYTPATKTLVMPITASKHPVVMLIDLYNPAGVERVGRGRLHNVPVRVAVRLAEKTIDVSQLMAMSPGQLIAFDKPAEDFLDLYVNNHLHGRGEAVKIGENFGIRISKLGVTKERVSPVLVPASPVPSS